MRIKWLSVVRVLGLALVLVYHFFPDVLPGGFLGVDVFFTFSGYLITALMIEEYRKSETFRALAYGKRRFQRIFPPLLFSLVLGLPFALLVSKDFTVGIGRQAAGVLGFATNYFEILTGGAYEAKFMPHLFLHTWSLAVEAHFYLFWGLLCAGLVYLINRQRNKRKDQTLSPAVRLFLLRWGLFLCAAALALASYLRMLVALRAAPAEAGTAPDFSRAYFGSGSHGFPFMIGSAAGALFGLRLKKSRRESMRRSPRRCAALSVAAGAVSLGGILALAVSVSFSKAFAFRFGMPAASLLAALLICAARALHEVTPKTLAEPRALSVPAELSYHIYLFHWPLYIVFSHVIPNNIVASLVTLLAAVACSAVTYYRLDPLFRGKLPPREWSGRGKSGPGSATKLTLNPRTLTAALLVLAVPLDLAVLARQPKLTSLDAQHWLESVRQDKDAVQQVRAKAAALNGSPIEDAGGAAAMERSQDTSVEIPVDAQVSGGRQDSGVLRGTTVLGDSICLDAREGLIQAVPDCKVDAQVSRFLYQGRDMMLQMQRADELREYVIIALGTNASDYYESQIEAIIDGLGPGRRLIFVTPYDGRWNKTWASYRTMEFERTLEAKYPYVTVADWAAAISGHTDLLAADGIHFRTSDAKDPASKLYVDCVLDAILRASRKPAK
ncbi:MAG: acyltransferase [Oscillospiraceae bacterium]|jgi:peptidoglycan/LPS O-acetylase OafA/YrhL|nr:acyltransferase [Oscillospiraceae bacterium]